MESDKLTEDTTNESQEVSPFPAGDHEAHINRRAQNLASHFKLIHIIYLPVVCLRQIKDMTKVCIYKGSTVFSLRTYTKIVKV